ncbi:unnamed protein product [Toxocara canis]|uniref:Uncharacterized protein n=1 Tax=Toxocara canis TaxID=6265 RepID=A0A183V0W4_TOXCA|nr:unnamed protein product [Toxocara canis]
MGSKIVFFTAIAFTLLAFIDTSVQSKATQPSKAGGFGGSSSSGFSSSPKGAFGGSSASGWGSVPVDSAFISTKNHSQTNGVRDVAKKSNANNDNARRLKVYGWIENN